jgi:PRC-barrel domain
VAEKPTGDKTDLRYLEADSVRCPAGNLSDFRVCTTDAESLGNIRGVLISPSTRRCEYLVIESRGLFNHRRFLLPVDAGAVVAEEPRTLKVSARKDELDLESFKPNSVRLFSDDDLVSTLITQDAA